MMIHPMQNQQLQTYMKYKIRLLTGVRNTRNGSAKIASLRHGVNCFPFSLPELWEGCLKDIPENFLSQNNTPTPEEWAIYTALTFFAFHQQGTKFPAHQEKISFGKAINLLKKESLPEELKQIVQRFMMVVQSSTMPELSNSLYPCIKLLKMKQISLDYIQLAEDIYFFQNPETRKAVQIQWGQDFYTFPLST